MLQQPKNFTDRIHNTRSKSATSCMGDYTKKEAVGREIRSYPTCISDSRSINMYTKLEMLVEEAQEPTLERNT